MLPFVITGFSLVNHLWAFLRYSCLLTSSLPCLLTSSCLPLSISLLPLSIPFPYLSLSFPPLFRHSRPSSVIPAKAGTQQTNFIVFYHFFHEKICRVKILCFFLRLGFLFLGSRLRGNDKGKRGNDNKESENNNKMRRNNNKKNRNNNERGKNNNKKCRNDNEKRKNDKRCENGEKSENNNKEIKNDNKEHRNNKGVKIKHGMQE